MTKKELSRLYGLNREIALEQRNLDELKKAEGPGRVAGLPYIHASNISTYEFSQIIKEQRKLVELKVQQLVIEYNRLNRYITGVQDPQMRIILSLRYINGLSWQRVASHIGGDNTADSVRMAHNRFLRKK